MSDTPNDSLFSMASLKALVKADYTLLTANARLARRCKLLWDQEQLRQGETVWKPLAVMPLEDWLKRRWQLAVAQQLLPPRVLISDGQALELWQMAIEEDQQSSGQYSLLNLRAGAKLAHDAHENLLRWQVDITTPAVEQLFEMAADSETFRRWHLSFSNHLRQRGMLTNAQCQLEVLRIAKKLPVVNLALLGFDDMPPLANACLSAHSAHQVELESRGQSAAVEVRGFPDQRCELEAIAQWVWHHHQNDPERRIGVILPDMESSKIALEYLLQRAFSDNYDLSTPLPVNFSGGVALQRVPLIRDALAVLGLTAETVAVPALVELLQSRFISLPDRESPAMQAVVTALFRQGEKDIGSATLRSICSGRGAARVDGTVLGHRLQVLTDTSSLRRRWLPSQWISHWVSILENWGWPGTAALNSLHYQQFNAWLAVLEEFSSYDTIVGVQCITEALGLLRRCCMGQVFQAKTENTPIQVLGTLEGAGLDFDEIWICAMQASQWPAGARPNPLIPLSIARSRNMPHASAEREWQFSADVFARYRRSAAVLISSYAKSLDGVPELPSQLLAEFPRVATESVHSDAFFCETDLALETVLDQHGPAVTAMELNGARNGSSIVEAQSNCPFQAFAKARLQAEPLPEFELTLSAAERGSVLHDALFHLYDGIESAQTLSRLLAPERQLLTENVASAALEALPWLRKKAIGGAYLMLEKAHLQKLLMQWLTLEGQRTEFEIIAREQSVEVELPPLKLRLRIDRIDKLDNDRFLVIDYKSGRCSLSGWTGERPSKPQLPLYALASSASIVPPGQLGGLTFAQLKSRDMRFVGTAIEAFAPGIKTDFSRVSAPENAVNWDVALEHWRRVFQRLATDFVDGHAAVDPLDNNSCTYCALQPLCRVGEPELAIQ